LKFLTDLIGPYPFDEFGYVEINSPGLAMETQTMILVDQAIFDSNPAPHSSMKQHINGLAIALAWQPGEISG